MEKPDLPGISGVVWEVQQHLSQVPKSVCLQWAACTMRGETTPLLLQKPLLLKAGNPSSADSPELVGLVEF